MFLQLRLLNNRRSFLNIIRKPVAKKLQGRRLIVLYSHSCGSNLTHCFREALGFSKVPKTRVITLLGARQVGLLGPFLWQECHKKEEKQKPKIKKKSAWPRKGPRGPRLSTLQPSCLIKSSDRKVLTQAFTTPCRKWEVTVEVETSAGA